jgi:hypothetical protein
MAHRHAPTENVRVRFVYTIGRTGRFEFMSYRKVPWWAMNPKDLDERERAVAVITDALNAPLARIKSMEID